MEDRPWFKFYDKGVPQHIDYPPIPLHGLLEEAARKYPDSPCTIFKGAVLSYREIDKLTDQLAAGIASLGVKKGDRVGIDMLNSPPFVITFFFPPFLAILFGLAKEKKMGFRVDLAPGDMWLKELISGHKPDERPKVTIGPEDTAIFQYSGGTTGISQGAIALHRNLVANALQIRACLPTAVDGKEAVLMAIPLFHVYGMVAGMLFAIRTGASMVLIPNPRDIVDVLTSIQKYKTSIFPGVPTQYNAINNNPDVIAGKYNLSSIKGCISGS